MPTANLNELHRDEWKMMLDINIMGVLNGIAAVLPTMKQQKKELAERIAEDVMRVLGYQEESVSVAMEEVAPEEWAEQVYRHDILENEERLSKEPGYCM